MNVREKECVSKRERGDISVKEREGLWCDF